MPSTRIAFVEDEADQRPLIAAILNRYFPNFSLKEIVSEQQFRAELANRELADCAAIVMDIMLAWTSLDDFVPPPPHYEGLYEGGLRCIQELRSTEWGRNIPVVVYTLIEPQDLSERLRKMDHVVYVNKAQPAELVKQLQSFLYHSLPN